MTLPETPASRPDGRPSATAQERLARAVRQDVAELEVRLEEATLRAEALALNGQPEAAVAALEEQRDLVARIEQRVAHHVSAAVVERDAEQVVASALASNGQAKQDRPPRRAPALTGVASAVAVVAALVLVLFPRNAQPPGIDAIGAASSGSPAPSATGGSGVPGGLAGDAATRQDAGADTPADPSGDDAATASRSDAVTADGNAPAPAPTGSNGLTALVEELLNQVEGSVGTLAGELPSVSELPTDPAADVPDPDGDPAPVEDPSVSPSPTDSPSPSDDPTASPAPEPSPTDAPTTRPSDGSSSGSDRPAGTDTSSGGLFDTP